jgi:hypothetical protein
MVGRDEVRWVHAPKPDRTASCVDVGPLYTLQEERQTAMTLVVSINGWRPSGLEPRSRWPRFETPTPCRVIIDGECTGVREARLRWERSELVADIDMPRGEGFVRATCTTHMEHDLVTGAQRHRIEAIEVRVEMASSPRNNARTAS